METFLADLTKLAAKDSLDRDDYNLANTVLSAKFVLKQIKDTEQHKKLEDMFGKVEQLRLQFNKKEQAQKDKLYKEMCDAIKNR